MRGSASQPLQWLFLRILDHFPSSHPFTVFNLGKIKGKSSSCNLQHKSIKSGTIPGLATGQGKGIFGDCWWLLLRCREKGLQGRWATKALNSPAHSASSFWPQNLFFHHPGPVFMLQVKISGLKTQQMARFPQGGWETPMHSPPPQQQPESAGQGFKSCLTSKPTSFHYSTQSLSKAVTLSVIYFKAPQYWWWDGHYVSKLNFIYLWGMEGYLHSLNRSLYSRGSSY